MFSRTTILELIKALNFQTKDEIERFTFELEIDGVAQGQYMKQKETSISKYLYENAEKKGPSGSTLIVDVVEYLLKKRPYDDYRYSDLVNALKKMVTILRKHQFVNRFHRKSHWLKKKIIS